MNLFGNFDFKVEHPWKESYVVYLVRTEANDDHKNKALYKKRSEYRTA